MHHSTLNPQSFQLDVSFSCFTFVPSSTRRICRIFLAIEDITTMDITPDHSREMRKQALKLGDDYSELLRQFNISDIPLHSSWEYWQHSLKSVMDRFSVLFTITENTAVARLQLQHGQSEFLGKEFTGDNVCSSDNHQGLYLLSGHLERPQRDGNK